MACDKNLLEQSSTQWQFGDWESLAKLNRNMLEHHPDRAKLALLAAAGLIQLGESSGARIMVNLSLDWGMSKKLVSQILIAGVHNSIGRTAALVGNVQSAFKHFEDAIQTGTPGNAGGLLAQARARHQLEQLGIESLRPHGKLFENTTDLLSNSSLVGKVVSNMIVINGMARSGSTVCMNIVSDLLHAFGIPFVKYYIEDFQDYHKIKDHVQQNPEVCFILKTHRINGELSVLLKSLSAVYIYSKRNLLEVSASFIRMSTNSESPFYCEKPVDLDQLFRFLDAQVNEYKKTIDREDCMVIDSLELSGVNITDVISRICIFLQLPIDDHVVSKIANTRSQKSSARYSSLIDESSLTSLRHDRRTFFHKDHVVMGGTPISEHIPDNWVASILERYSSLVDKDGYFA